LHFPGDNQHQEAVAAQEQGQAAGASEKGRPGAHPQIAQLLRGGLGQRHSWHCRPRLQ